MKSQYSFIKAELKDTKNCCQMVRNGGLILLVGQKASYNFNFLHINVHMFENRCQISKILFLVLLDTLDLDRVCIKINLQLTWSDIELWNFYKIELVPGSCHISVVVAGACVVDLSLTWLFKLKIAGQQKTIWKSIAKGMNVLYNSISIWCYGLCINKRCYHISKVC